jgi:hypothetical protein
MKNTYIMPKVCQTFVLKNRLSMECLQIVPQRHTTDQQTTRADMSYNTCVQLILNCDFKILHDYFIVYNQVWIVAILSTIMESRVSRQRWI